MARSMEAVAEVKKIRARLSKRFAEGEKKADLAAAERVGAAISW